MTINKINLRNVIMSRLHTILRESLSKEVMLTSSGIIVPINNHHESASDVTINDALFILIHLHKTNLDRVIIRLIDDTYNSHYLCPPCCVNFSDPEFKTCIIDHILRTIKCYEDFCIQSGH